MNCMCRQYCNRSSNMVINLSQFMSSAQNKDKYRLYVSDYTLKLSLQLFNLQTTYNFNVNSLRQLFIIHIKFKLCRKQCTFFVSKCFSFFFHNLCSVEANWNVPLFSPGVKQLLWLTTGSAQWMRWCLELGSLRCTPGRNPSLLWSLRSEGKNMKGYLLSVRIFKDQRKHVKRKGLSNQIC